MKTILKTTAAALAFAVVAASPVFAGTLENMERERAIMLETLLSGNMTPAERQSKSAIARVRLIDLERMVLRDESLTGKNTPHVRAAFENYDLTFLIHASAENNRAPLDHWLTQLGVSTQSVMGARPGLR
ncbi:MAG: hypothetical protein JJ900_16060 [Rhodospirillales bacterium]|nr:hypothetical protein [Rhodospirillales bacterium]MBO6788363.1 hypothetical protein [Rhodospirillales bacterium]